MIKCRLTYLCISLYQPLLIMSFNNCIAVAIIMLCMCVLFIMYNFITGRALFLSFSLSLFELFYNTGLLRIHFHWNEQKLTLLKQSLMH